MLVFDPTAAIAKSDTIISNELKESLRIAAGRLEYVLPHQKDFHPGSDEKVLDLVHPSLFPLVYGTTRILPTGKVGLEDATKRISEGETIAYQGSNERRRGVYFSHRFQWLPCDVAFVEDDEVRIQSYVNNLHPQKHKDLYRIIEQVIAKTIPLWNEVLSSVDAGSDTRITVDEPEYDCPLQPSPLAGDKPEPEKLADQDAPTEGENEAESPDDADSERPSTLDDDDWWRQNRVLKHPEPGEFQPLERYEYAPPPVDLRRDFLDTGLQVIVKLANIELTPEKPKYEGGSWHIEGQLNEHICASAIYYYDSKNTTASCLCFRQTLSSDELLLMAPQV